MEITRRQFFAAVASLALAGCGSSSSGGNAAETVDEAPAQTFDYEQCTIEYRGTQDAAGNAVVTFAFTNKLDATVMVAPENVVVNGEYAVQALGGSQVPIASGQTGAVSLSFGVSVQTPLAGTDDLETLKADLIIMDDATLERLYAAPVDVTI